jgi:hypothetical protein
MISQVSIQWKELDWLFIRRFYVFMKRFKIKIWFSKCLIWVYSPIGENEITGYLQI